MVAGPTGRGTGAAGLGLGLADRVTGLAGCWAGPLGCGAGCWTDLTFFIAIFPAAAENSCELLSWQSFGSASPSSLQ
jgi:hypothetical protein